MTIDPRSDTELGIESTLTEVGAVPAARDGAPLDGASVRRFQHCAELGKGGLGRVDRHWDCDLLRNVAVKQLRSEHEPTSQMLKRFLWEARVTAYLSHPNIVPVYDIGTTESGRISYTMQHVDGESLADLLDRDRREGERNRAATLSARLRMFVQICNALASAHSQGILHRDLKPSNIMVGDHGRVLVVDWGLAAPSPSAPKWLHELAPSDAQGAPLGTLMYMPPEQAAGDVSQIDVRSDVFGLGMILYQIASGKRPYDVDTSEELLRKAKLADMIPIRRAAPRVPRALKTIVNKAVAQRPGDRYPNVEALRIDIERFLDDLPPESEVRWWHSELTQKLTLRLSDLTAAIIVGVFLGFALGLALPGFADVSLSTAQALEGGAYGLGMLALGLLGIRWVRAANAYQFAKSSRLRTALTTLVLVTTTLFGAIVGTVHMILALQ